MSKSSKKIYIVLAHTGTILSKIIKNFTFCEFSHVSISLDKNLDKMYSFGRLNPYNPFFGGFVHESIESGTFKRFDKTTVKVYSINVTEEQYNKIENIIKYFENNSKNYKFNVLGLFASGFNIQICKNNSFYCAEFVKHVIENAGIEINLPKIIRPEDFKFINNKDFVYKGLLQKYKLYIR